MKKFKYISVLLLSFGTLFSQSRDQILNELSELLKSQGNPSELFYVESEGFLDIHNHQIKLYEAKLRYEESNGPMLGFYCAGFSSKCIYNPRTKQEMSNFSFRMKDKEGVYQAIELINKIPYANNRYKVDALMGGLNSDGKAKGGEGNDSQPGDKGKVTGDPNAKGYYGSGGGGGGGNYRLGNRQALNKPKPAYNCNEEGNVYVSITVDQNGHVIAAQAGVKGTTNSATCLLESAKEAALKTKFSPDASAPARQIGVIIYNFSLSE
ncbi:MAG: hypothetical protein WBN19_01905 [Lutimonas sp.]